MSSKEHSIDSLHSDGTLKWLFDRGFLGPKFMLYVEYRKSFMRFRVSMSYRESCERAAIEHSVSVETVKRAIKVLKQ